MRMYIFEFSVVDVVEKCFVIKALASCISLSSLIVILSRLEREGDNARIGRVLSTPPSLPKRENANASV